jgi:hypothetical protein
MKKTPFVSTVAEAPFPVRFQDSQGKGGFRFQPVSYSFPFVSRFHAYMQETRNEQPLMVRCRLGMVIRCQQKV